MSVFTFKLFNAKTAWEVSFNVQLSFGQHSESFLESFINSVLHFPTANKEKLFCSNVNELQVLLAIVVVRQL